MASGFRHKPVFIFASHDKTQEGFDEALKNINDHEHLVIINVILCV